MIVIITILAILAGGLLALMLTPWVIEIDTTADVYQFRFGGLAKVWPSLESDTICLNIQVPFKRFRITDFRSSNDSKPKISSKHPPREQRKGKAPKVTSRQIIAILRSVKIRKFRWELDTDDYARNGQLYPLFYWAREQGVDCSINFQGSNHLCLEASGTLMKMGWAWIKSS